MPTLYRKVTQLKKKTKEIYIQDAYITCKRFLKSIFEAGLSATLITEERKEVKPIFELITNDVSSQPITEKISRIFNEATGEILIMGWIGTFFVKKLRELKNKGVSIRAITHKPKEAKGQPWAQEISRAYKELIDIIGLECISIKPELHGRAVIVDNKAIIGSMDLNAYSLTGSHIEFAMYTEDSETVRNLRNYFNRIFSPLKE